MKTCSKCKVEKDEAEFSKLSRAKDGLDSRCKSCIREYQHTDGFNEYRKAYNQTDARKASEKTRKQTDAYKVLQKAYSQTDAFKASQKAYRLRKKAAAAGNTAPSSGTQTMVAQG